MFQTSLNVRVNTKLLPNSNLGWFCLGICLQATILKIGTNIPGIYGTAFSFLFLLVSLLLFLPPKLTKPFERKMFYAILASFFFLLFADTNQISNPRQPNPTFRNFLREELQKSPLSPFETRIVMGLLTGSTKEIPRDFKELAKESGILHLFAASGLHLGIFIGSLQFLGNLIFIKHRWISILISLGFGFLYLYVLNFPVSFVRAYLFVFLTLVSSLFYRKIAVSDLLIISSAGIAFFLFSDFLSIGFLLSFGAVFGIFYLKPSLDQMIFPNSKSLWKENLTLTTVCSLCSFPILVYYFQSFSYGGVWINYCLVPLAGILLPSLYFTLLIQIIIPNDLYSIVSEYLWSPACFFTSIFLKFFKSIALTERAYKIWQGETLFFILLSVILIFSIWLLHRFEWHKKKFLSRIVTTIVILFFPFSYWLNRSFALPFVFQQGKGFFTLALRDRFYLFGNCSRHKRMELPILVSPIKQILFESESCLQTVLRLRKKHNLSEVIWYDQTASPFGNLMAKEGIQIKTSNHLGGDISPSFSLFRFDGNPKRINSLIRSLKETERERSQNNWTGYLVLDFPPWKKKEAKDWITYQKLLGISNAWKILIVEDQFEIPLLHNHTNPNLL
ncbi:MAG: ComEC/Rec2 family competence protein [Leptospira bouyouniensis]